jgi:hypothetical protein
MALQQSTITYSEVCLMPACICEDADVVFFLQGGLLTTAGLPYLAGTVVLVTQLSTGAVEVVIQYDDATLPEVDGETLQVIFPGAAVTGTVCAPDCAGDCDWMGKVLAVQEAADPQTQYLLERQIYAPANWVANGTFVTPRMTLSPGMRLSAVKITCDTYDSGTTLTINLKVGATVVAQYVGNLSAQKSATILVNDILNDQKPTVEITGTAYVNYATAAKGLIVTLLGVTTP